MDINEFIKEAKKLFYTEQEINKILSNYYELIRKGIKPLPLEMYLVEKVIDN
ncbi:MAG: hypothetical protein GX275_11980 [Clostridiales bacterium]|nr:hypothetical protein [Clostridiales bacterium]